MKKQIIKTLLIIIFSLILIGCSQNEDSNINEELIGTWEADNAQTITDEESTEKVEPYTLIIYIDGNFSLNMNTETVAGKYEIDKNNNVKLISEETINCKLKKEELTCDKYATKFQKKEPEK